MSPAFRVMNLWLGLLVEMGSRMDARRGCLFSCADASPPPVAAEPAGPHEGATRKTEAAMRAMAEKKSIWLLRPRTTESRESRLVFMYPKLRAILSHYDSLINREGVWLVWRGVVGGRTDHGSAVNRYPVPCTVVI